jgi:hypothetical protein
VRIPLLGRNASAFQDFPDPSSRVSITGCVLMSPDPTPALDRRRTLQALASLPLAAGAVQASTSQTQAYNAGDEARARYRETEHVKAFYRTNGYETLKR